MIPRSLDKFLRIDFPKPTINNYKLTINKYYDY